MSDDRYQERSVASLSVELKLGAESIRRLKGLPEYNQRGNPGGGDPLGNREAWKADLAYICQKLIASKLGASSGFSVTPDGDIDG